ncbi:MAG: AraC family transcriptional regulator [Pseudomonadota bacterium]
MTPIEQGSVSVPALQQYLACARALGCDTVDILSRHEIGEELLSDNTQRLPGDVFQAILKVLIRDTADPLFGLKTAQHVQPITYSIYGYMAMNSRNLGEAIEHTPEYEKLVGDMGTTKLIPRDGNSFARWDCNMTDPLVRRHVIENVLASWTIFARWITGKNEESPLEVRIEHEPPRRRELLPEYDRLFGCPVLFGQEETGVLLSPEAMALPLIQADQTVFSSLQETANQRLAALSGQTPVAVQVKSALRALMKDGIPRKDMVAERIGMTSRTMQRRLKEEDVSYQNILNELRHAMAIDLLENTELTLEDIGHRLGFQEPRSFHRSFKTWTGQTPGHFRRHV